MVTEICLSRRRSRALGEGVAAEDTRLWPLMMAVIGLCQILTLTGPAGNLKN